MVWLDFRRPDFRRSKTSVISSIVLIPLLRYDEVPSFFDMNYWRFRGLSRVAQRNHVFRIIDVFRNHLVMKGARLDVACGIADPQKVVIILGQVHTVWRGKIGHRERRQIVACQARLCSYYALFEELYDLTEFGGEGLYEGVSTDFADRKCFELYEPIRRRLVADNRVLTPEELPTVAVKILDELAKRWQEELRHQRDIGTLRLYASAVSGQTLFNFLTPNEIRVFGVEGEEAYRKVLKVVDELGERLAQLEQTHAFRAVRQRNGKVQTSKERDAVLLYNELAEQFNRMIKSDIRERATLELLVEKAKKADMTVLTMGYGHRKNYLRLARRSLKGTDIAFVFLTPPELLPHLWLRIGVPVLFLLTFGIVWWWMG